MAYNDKFGEGEWVGDSRCSVCGDNMGQSRELICSATCEDVAAYGQRQREPLMDYADDCYV